jgi:hypothetical protein
VLLSSVEEVATTFLEPNSLLTLVAVSARGCQAHPERAPVRCSAATEKNVGANLATVPRTCGLQLGLGLYGSVVVAYSSRLYSAVHQFASLATVPYCFRQRDKDC